jgi:hypothetical protein
MKNSKSDTAGPQVARLLRALASLVEASDPAEVTDFLRRRAPALLSAIKRSGGREDAAYLAHSTPPEDLSILAEKLQSLSSRDEGNALLSSASLTRRELEKLGRLLGTPILKTDNMERLMDRIIEASIGFRLSSAAIRGNHTKGSPY